MGLFQTSFPQSLSGVYAAKVPAPASVTPTGTGASIITGQFAWGPPNVFGGYAPNVASLLQTYGPAGSNRINSAYLSVIRKAWPLLGAVRVEGTGAVASSGVIQSVSLSNLLTVTAAYTGVMGNSIIVTIGAAGDGNTNHFKLTATLTGTSGVTTEIYDNLNISGVGADVLPPSIKGLGNVAVLGNVGSQQASSVLLSTIVKTNPGLPAVGNTTLSGGTDGTVTATQYVGTTGLNDFGLALLESDRIVNNLYFDDPGNALRAACNSGMLGHVTLMSDRIGFVNGNSGQTAASAQSDVANYRSPYLCYVDPWAYIYDDVTSALQLVPSACWGASVASQLPPSVSLAFRGVAAPLMNQIISLEANRGSNAGTNTAAGITTIDYGTNGGFYFEQDVNTSAIAGSTDLLSSRMDQFLGRSVVNSWQYYVNAPNIAFFQQPILDSLQTFLLGLQSNAQTNPAVLPFISGFSNPSNKSTAADIKNGIFKAFATVAYGSSMKNVAFMLQSGVGITISSS
jgi:hypothetical protein